MLREWLQATRSVEAAPFSRAEAELIESGRDVPQPLFSGNECSESSTCLLNRELKCAPAVLPAMHAKGRHLEVLLVADSFSGLARCGYVPCARRIHLIPS
jgi:hypothetical protein